MGREIGRRRWAIANGFLPPEPEPEPDAEPAPAPAGYEGAFLLNAGDVDAKVELTVYFAEREPAGPYQAVVPSRRTLPLRLDQLDDPEAIPRGVAYAVVIESTVPIVVQHTRVELARDWASAISTIAWPEP